MSIVLEDVSHIYMPGTPYEQTAIQGINLTISQGDFLGIIGHTGSGKSTLSQHLNGLLKPTAGKVSVDGTDIHQKNKESKLARRKVGMVFQYPEHQIFEETIYADIAFGPRNLELNEDEVEHRVRRAMDFVGLDYEEMKDRSPFQLSGGQMRRVAIAGVIALEPEYLILDEPSAGLDPRGRDEIFGQVERLYRETGIAVVLVSHNMDDIARLANRLIVMNRGEIFLDGTPQNIFLHHRPELKEAGVDIPNIVGLLTLLKERGLQVDDSALTVEEAVERIHGVLGKAVRHAE